MKLVFSSIFYLAVNAVQATLLAQVTPLGTEQQAWRVQIETLEKPHSERYLNLPNEIRSRLYIKNNGAGEFIVFAGDYFNPLDAEKSCKDIIQNNYKQAYIVKFNLQDKLYDEPLLPLERDLQYAQQNSETIGSQLYGKPSYDQRTVPASTSSDIGSRATASPHSFQNPDKSSHLAVANKNNSNTDNEQRPSDNAKGLVLVAEKHDDKPNVNTAQTNVLPALRDNKADSTTRYFVQLGLFERLLEPTKYQQLTDINPVLTRQVTWKGKLVTQIVVGPFKEEMAAKHAQEIIEARQFEGHTIAVSFHQTELQLLLNNSDEFVGFKYLFKNK